MSNLNIPSAILGLILSLSAGLAATATDIQSEDTNVHMWADVIALIDSDEREFAVTPVGRNRVLFTRSTNDHTTIYETIRAENGTWSKPQPVSFAVDDDADPFFDPYSGILYYMSRASHADKAENADDYDIWKVELHGDEWAKPQPLAPGVDTSAQEVFPTTDKDGTLYFASNRDGGYGGHDIYIARKGSTYWHSENAGPVINSPVSDSNPCIMPDGKTLIFYSRKENGYGEVDLYRTDGGLGGWNIPQNLGATINGPKGEYAPGILDAGTFIYSRGEKLITVPMHRVIG